MADGGDDILDNACEYRPEPSQFGNVLLRWWMLAHEAVERQHLLLAKELGPILTLICKLRVAPLIWRVLVCAAKDLMLDGLVGENL
jgi:hypothetical protein